MDHLVPGEPRRVIRLFPDYGHRWPLWENSTEWRDTDYLMTPEHYALSPEVTRALRGWYDFWESHFRNDHTWDTPESGRAWREQGASVAAALRQEVDEWAVVEYEGVP